MSADRQQLCQLAEKNNLGEIVIMQIKKPIIVILAALIVLVASFSTPMKAYAMESLEKNRVVERVERELDKYNQLYFAQTRLTLTESEITEDFIKKINSMNDEELHEYIGSLYMIPTVMHQNRIEKIEISSDNYQTTKSADWGEYTTVEKECSVNSSIPSIGFCKIHIPYTAVIKKMLSTGNWYIDSVTIGTSYQTGISVASWSQTDSTVEIGSYQTYANLIVTGVLTYGIPYTPILGQTKQSFIYCLRADEVAE